MTAYCAVGPDDPSAEPTFVAAEIETAAVPDFFANEPTDIKHLLDLIGETRAMP